MIVFVPVIETEAKSEKKILPSYIPELEGQEISFEDYLNFNYKEHGIKYEWNKGILEAKERLKPQETKIYKNLHNKFIKNPELLETYEIITEVESHLISQKKVRIPDIGIFLQEDIQKYKVGKPFFPVIAIEIISPSDQAEELEIKVKEYLVEGVKSVWCIFPKLKQVKIYNSLKQITTCIEDDICDTSNIIPCFSITVNELFKDF